MCLEFRGSLLDWQLLLPHRVFMLRGNHETKFCTSAYGFEQEVMSKFGDRAKHLYRKCLGCFEGHPLAARVAGCVYMAHGGLFRQVEKEPPKKQKGKSYRYGCWEGALVRRDGLDFSN